MSEPAKLPFLPDGHHYAIVAVTSRAAQLDHMIPRTILALLSPIYREHTARFLLKNLAMDRLVKLLQALLLDRFPSEAGAINSMIKSIETARSERNRIIHWLWGKSEAAESVTLAKISPFLDEQFVEMTAVQIQRVADDLLNAFVDLARWSDRAWEQTKATLQPTVGLGLLGLLQEPPPE
jgi:hypothetical protein